MTENLRRSGIAFIAALACSVPTWAAEGAPSRFIRVSGGAEVRVVPDEVVLTLGIETRDPQLKPAKEENDRRLKKVLETATAHEIEEKHIQIDHISIEPRYETHKNRQTFIEYVVRKTVVLTLRDIGKFDDLLSAVLESGANYVHGIQFRTTELRKHRDRARVLAIKAAHEKAVALAEELGQKVGKPQSISEGRGRWYSAYGSWWGSHQNRGMMQNIVQGDGGEALEEGILAPGQITVNATVSVSFALQ